MQSCSQKTLANALCNRDVEGIPMLATLRHEALPEPATMWSAVVPTHASQLLMNANWSLSATRFFEVRTSFGPGFC